MGKFLRLVNGRPMLQDEAGITTIYDEIYAVSGTISTGTLVTLPNSGTYTANELEVRLNGMRLEPVFDYNYAGSAPRTQISFTFDLVDSDRVRFRVDRAP